MTGHEKHTGISLIQHQECLPRHKSKKGSCFI